jgi:predicted nuclease of restriction endonuclease-like (RecB) superfamily
VASSSGEPSKQRAKPRSKKTGAAAAESRLNLGCARSDGKAQFPATPPKSEMPSCYGDTLGELTALIRETRLRTVLSANAAMIQMYWGIGRIILARQAQEGWGAKVIDRLSADLRHAFPDMSGLSPRNLKYMRAFSMAWPDPAIVQERLHNLTWYHQLALLEKLPDPQTRLWYAAQAQEHGWSRNILAVQIERGIHQRQGKAITNFKQALPPTASDLAEQIFKDPYLFDMLGTADHRREAEVEQALVDHVQKFLLELGAGFAFVGRQVPLEVGNSDFKIDLLFYHFKLHSFVVIELKAVPFEPGFVGQLNLYLAATDDLLKQPADNPTIGLLLCRGKNKLVAEYALRGVGSPMGVADWETTLVEKLPKEFEGSLPTIAQIEAELMPKKRGKK